ncbi:hypothetical protein C8J57DRAFT_1584615 [Mycena rebaudengoi]|nr:hypothetical protein C8J57DRAFT_1584615 [Mycena rebaudengoi]
MAAPPIIINVPLGLPAFNILPPPAPANPPTAVDVVNAQKYNQQIQAAVVAADHALVANTPRPTATDVAEGLLYETNGHPTACQCCCCASMVSGVGPSSFPALLAMARAARIFAAQHLLPALTNIAAIRALTANQSTNYALGYNLVPAGNHSNRKRIIARHIGYLGYWA